jgi:hypothetical protein
MARIKKNSAGQLVSGIASACSEWQKGIVGNRLTEGVAWQSSTGLVIERVEAVLNAGDC